MTVSLPAHTRFIRWFLVAQFVLWLAGGALLLARGGEMAPAQRLIWGAALLACLGALAAAWRRRLSVWEALMVEAGALATATSAFGLGPWHYATKPAGMVFAIVSVVAWARPASARGLFGMHPSVRWLLCALLGSLAGDVFLMLPGLFIPGLVSFLIAHLCYIGLFRQGSPWLGHRTALAATLALGVGMYAFLWQGGLPVELRLPVAVYVLAIALMTAQAWARWKARPGRPALWAALGASCFMLSDSILATDRFVRPLPWALVCVLASYYAAQALIVIGTLRSLPSAVEQRRQPHDEG